MTVHLRAENQDVAEVARRARVLALQTVSDAQVGHIGADLSVIDILCCIYDLARVGRDTTVDIDRDRVILSKAHAAAAFYSVLALHGFIKETELDTFGSAGSRLATVVSTRCPGVEFSTGSLGHGLSYGVGAAIAARIQGSDRRVFIVVGDGELQEGSNWEAAMLAGAQRLGSVSVVVDRNRSQKGAGTEDTNALEPLADKWAAFGWAGTEVDGHDPTALRDAITARDPESRPSAIIANTVKGRGVSFMENDVSWHGRTLSRELCRLAVEELGG